jgi:uncharacterized membrane protein
MGFWKTAFAVAVGMGIYDAGRMLYKKYIVDEGYTFRRGST